MVLLLCMMLPNAVYGVDCTKLHRLPIWGVRVEMESIVVEDCVPAICRYFGIDPYASVSEGTLIISCREYKAQDILTALHRKGIIASIVGEFTEPKLRMVLVQSGKEEKLEHPIVDPF
jgi:hydrogenase expression/formation protein HypE